MEELIILIIVVVANLFIALCCALTVYYFAVSFSLVMGLYEYENGLKDFKSDLIPFTGIFRITIKKLLNCINKGKI